MKYALNLSEDRHILSATYEEYAVEEMPIVESLPEGDVSDYIYNEDGTYTYSPIPEEPKVIVPTEEEDTAAMLIDHEYRLTLLELGIV